MRKVSMKRKSGRKSAKQDENGVSDNQNTNSEASVNETENGDFGDTEDSEPQKKRRSGSTTNKRKSVSFSSKKEDNDEEEESQYEVHINLLCVTISYLMQCVLYSGGISIR